MMMSLRLPITLALLVGILFVAAGMFACAEAVACEQCADACCEITRAVTPQKAALRLALDFDVDLQGGHPAHCSFDVSGPALSASAPNVPSPSPTLAGRLRV